MNKTFNMDGFSDLKISLLIVWSLISIIVFGILALPFITDSETIFRITPECQWQIKFGRECILCGMTRSFVLISKGCFTQAHSLNRGSILLFLFFVSNDVVFFASLFKLAVSRLRLSRG